MEEILNRHPQRLRKHERREEAHVGHIARVTILLIIISIHLDDI
jgi:hypothetical protein